MNANPLRQIAEQCRRLLTEQPISAAGPGTILNDIETMLAFIGVDGIATGSKHGNLPPAALSELNARISQPVELGMSRALLRDYPNLAGLSLLLRMTHLTTIHEERLRLDETQVARWSSLNPTEKYFALLETWLLYGNEEVVGVASRHYADPFTSNLLFLAQTLSSRWKTFDERCHVHQFLGCVSALHVQLHARFGLIEIQPRSLERASRSPRGWIMARARRTPWGDAVAWGIIESAKPGSQEDLMYLAPPEEAGFGFLQPAFQPYFPEWQNAWSVPQLEPVRGTYVFKVALDPRCAERSVWRRLAVPDQTTLDALASAILDAFRFKDHDHLYEFHFRDRYGRTMKYHHPFGDETPFANEITVGDTGLREKETMKFQFDFGDDWRFDLRLERIEPLDKKLRKPRVIASAGKPPRQYSDWE